MEIIVRSQEELAAVVAGIVLGVSAGLRSARDAGVIVQTPESIQIDGIFITELAVAYEESQSIDPAATTTSTRTQPAQTTTSTRTTPATTVTETSSPAVRSESRVVDNVENDRTDRGWLEFREFL